MTDVWEGEGGTPVLRAEDALKPEGWRERERPLDIMQKARLARGGRGAIEPVGDQVFSPAVCTHPEDCEEHKQPSLVLTSPVPYVTNAQGAIGELTTRELLEELRLRGDLAMTVMPTTPRGQAGSFLSAAAGMLLIACDTDTLEAVRGQ